MRVKLPDLPPERTTADKIRLLEAERTEEGQLPVRHRDARRLVEIEKALRRLRAEAGA